MPIIFASSMMLFPHAGLRLLGEHWNNTFSRTLVSGFDIVEFLYEFIYIGMIFFFSYFWNTVQFQPKEMANQLRDYGSFIPGLRPGPRTAEYLENVMTRMTYVGAAFLCVIAVLPSVVYKGFDVSFTVSSFLGGTGLLIVISVMLDLVNRIEANLVMRHYGGFLDEGGSGAKNKKSKGGPVGGSRPTQSAA
jgi:preprotein translocase subunit SecY